MTAASRCCANVGRRRRRSAPLVFVSSKASAEEKQSGSNQISPTEDLMREHGVLNRVLLVYEGTEKLSKSQDFDVSVLAQGANIVRSFISMYRPHEAREDAELFPKLRQIVSRNEFDAMGEDFERDERRHFGEDGFAAVVASLGPIERAVGIHDLRKSTPQ